jgi:hypothetical protein
LEILALLD